MQNKPIKFVHGQLLYRIGYNMQSTFHFEFNFHVNGSDIINNLIL